MSALAKTSPATGLFVAIVGPSGAGKDALIRGLAGRLGEGDGVFYARRVVTRRADAFEDHDTLAEDDIRGGARRGRFALAWSAHGLHYGVPCEIEARLAAGHAVVCNVSRAVVAEVRRRYRPSARRARHRAAGNAGGAARRARPRGRREPARASRSAPPSPNSPSSPTRRSTTTARSTRRWRGCATSSSARLRSAASMMTPLRYAVYLAPPPESALWRFGSAVVGRDAASGEARSGFAPDGIRRCGVARA